MPSKIGIPTCAAAVRAPVCGLLLYHQLDHSHTMHSTFVLTAVLALAASAAASVQTLTRGSSVHITAHVQADKHDMGLIPVELDASEGCDAKTAGKKTAQCALASTRIL
jgi:hypothetical protein